MKNNYKEYEDQVDRLIEEINKITQERDKPINLWQLIKTFCFYFIAWFFWFYGFGSFILYLIKEYYL